MGMLGPDDDPVQCVTTGEVGCQCVMMEEVVCGATNIDTAAEKDF